MTDKSPSQDDDQLPDAEAEARFQRTLRNLVNTPHTPHKPSPESKGAAPKGKK
jgi:hypothetical protein